MTITRPKFRKDGHGFGTMGHITSFAFRALTKKPTAVSFGTQHKIRGLSAVRVGAKSSDNKPSAQGARAQSQRTKRRREDDDGQVPFGGDVGLQPQMVGIITRKQNNTPPGSNQKSNTVYLGG